MLRISDIELSLPKGKEEVDTPGISQAYKYLRDRGINREDIDDYGIVITPARELITAARQVHTKFEEPRLAIIFPHYDTQGHQIDWWSARLVETGLRPKVVTSFAQYAAPKLGKMFCPPSEAPHAYLPPTLDWTKLPRGARIYIHESCIKAINCAKLGYWSIGLNGVRGWSSKKHYVALVEELKSLPWKALQLEPTIVFDSNAADNWDVQLAISQLAAKIFEITGQRANHILLPKGPDGDIGFDDYCQTHGDAEVREYLEQEGREIEISELETLKMQLNGEVCVVRSLGKIVEQETGTLMTRQTFIDINYATYTTFIDDKVINVPRLWLADPRRIEVDKITYAPGKPRIINGDLNLWQAGDIQPLAGDAQPWLEVLDRNVQDPTMRKWMLQWMAYPLQNVGAKLTTYIHMWGPPGAGKQALLYPLMKIYAKNAIIISKREVTSDFNSIYANKQFINIDELHGGNDNEATTVTNKIKLLVTKDTLSVNTKGQPEYEVPNCANVVSTSNYLDAIKLDEDDRRTCVVKFGERGKVIKDPEYWEPWWAWIEEEGSAIVYNYLLGVDLTGFDPKGWAPGSSDKEEMTKATRTREQAWVNELWDNPDQVLPPPCKNWWLATTDQLAVYCFGEDPMGVTPSKKMNLGLRMNECGFQKIELKIENRKVRFWVIRNKNKDFDARKHLISVNYPGLK